MESLRRSNKWGWTAFFTLLWIVLWLFGGLLFMLPALALVMPAVLGYMGVKAGPVCYLGCGAIAVGFMGWLLGAPMALVVALVLLPPSVYALIAMDRGVPFSKAAGITGLLLLGCGGAALGVGTWLAGGDLVGGLVGALESMLSRMPQTDTLLYSMYANGLFKLPPDMDVLVPMGEYFQLTAQARAELTRSLMLYLDQSLRLAMPSQWVTGSILGGALATLLPRFAARQRGEAVDFLPLRAWKLPKGSVRALGATLLALFLLSWMGLSALSRTVYVVWEAASLIISLQGLAVIDYQAHAHGVRRMGRAAIALLGFVLLRFVLLILGLMDEMIGLRGQRKIPFPPDGMNGGDDGEDDF